VKSEKCGVFALFVVHFSLFVFHFSLSLKVFLRSLRLCDLCVYSHTLEKHHTTGFHTNT